MDFQKYDDLFCRRNYPVFDGNFLPKDDSPCICLSGNKYKNCCKKDVEAALQHDNDKRDAEELKNIYQQSEKKLISTIIEHKAVNKKNISYCLAEKILGNCDLHNNVKSHTLARGSVLTNLAGADCDVVSFNDHIMVDCNMIKKNIEIYYKQVKLKDASLTVSYCKEHDKELFLDIEVAEKCKYEKKEIQNLEYALKAISFQIYYYIENIKYFSKLIQTSKKVFGSYNGGKSHLLEHYSVYVDELFRLHPISQRMIQEIQNFKQGKMHTKLKTVYFKLPCKRINISCSEVIEEQGVYYFINVINAPEPYMIFSYYEEQENQEVWIKEIKKEFDEENCREYYITNFILSFIVTNAQNIYINKTKFNQLSEDEKIYLYVIHREGTIGIPDEYQDKLWKNMYHFFFEN